MKMSKFEREVSGEIEKLIHGEDSKSNYSDLRKQVPIQNLLVIKTHCYVNNNKWKGTILLTLEVEPCKPTILIVRLELQSDIDEDEDRYSWCTLPIPENEEEHFQLSTTQDVLFEFEFFELIKKAFDVLNT